MLSSIILLFLLPLVHSSDITDRVDEMAEAMMSCLHVPGLSLAVVHKGDVVMQKGYGLADVEEGIPVTKDTLFPIASTTKAFTSTLLAMLLNESRYIHCLEYCISCTPWFDHTFGQVYVGFNLYNYIKQKCKESKHRFEMIVKPWMRRPHGQWAFKSHDCMKLVVTM